MISRNGKLFVQFLVILGLLTATSLSQASVQASIDRPIVYEGESFTLLISSDGKQREMPDLSLLEKDFQILGTGNSQQVQIINGVMTSKTSWTISLQAKTSGKLHIPSLRVGKELTNPIQVTVSAPPVASSAKDGQHIFIEAEVASSDQPVYLQQQILYTVRLVFDQPILDGSLSEPAPDNALVEQLAKNKRYTSQRNGKPFTVIERRYAIFPEKSGELVIPPLRFTGSLVSRTAGRRQPSGIDPSMRRFFGGDPFASAFDRGRPVTVQGKALSIQVLPRPASYSASDWLPSAELKLNDSWLEQPPEFKVGEPVSRSITIQAKGMLATLLPTLDVNEVDGVKIYPEQPVSETQTDGVWVYGISKQNLTYMPTKAGALVIPELKLHWWDTEAGVERTAVLPQWSVDVVAGKNLPAGSVVQTENTAEAGQMSDLPIGDSVDDPDSRRQTGWLGNTLQKYWLLLILLVLIIALFLRRNRVSGKNADKGRNIPFVAEDNAEHIRSQRELQKRLHEACNSNDANAAVDVLLEMAALAKPENPPKTLPALAALLDQGSEELILLDRFLYATDETGWDGRRFYEKFRNGLAFRASEKPVRDVLEPLYPD
ncbi:MAG: BatD family protein [Pseudomonadota bacterium]|nr:BatD family protein [Pseudomonadota bacterium]